MRVVTFNGTAVKRQKKIDADKILLWFYSRKPQVVSVAEWEAGKQNMYFGADAPRHKVVRTLA